MHNKRTLFHLAIAILVLVSAACLCAQPAADSGPSIVGTWQGTYQGSSLEFIFESNGYFTFTIDGMASNGQYVLDTSANPARLDLHYTDGMEVISIIAFTDSNTLRMENTNPGDPLPTGFSDYADLVRVSP